MSGKIQIEIPKERIAEFCRRHHIRRLSLFGSYKKILREKLSDPEQAAEYLTACYDEGPEVFLLGLRDVVEAQGGVARLAELSKLNRESLYRLVSRNGNPV